MAYLSDAAEHPLITCLGAVTANSRTRQFYPYFERLKLTAVTDAFASIDYTQLLTLTAVTKL